MAINPLYIPLFNIEEVILDKDSGLPLAAGVVEFFRDSQRVTPKVVYQISGTSPNYSFVSVGSSLILGIAGDFVDQDGNPFVPYAYPYDTEGELDLYYVTVESEGGISQFVRQAVPYVDTGGISPSERSSTENELSNPQFVEVNFPTTDSVTINVTGSNTVTSVAPDWDLITSGTGTIDLERLEPTSAGVVTNPPYTLRINASAGLGSTVALRQRLTNTPSIFRGGFASGSITAAVISGGNSSITMTYAPSTGTSTEIIPSTSIPTDGAYHTIANNVEIPDQGNTAASAGYVDIIITLPTNRNIAVTSIQAVGTSFSVNIPYDEKSVARQKDQLFHYYENELITKPKKSLLVAWNFSTNPYQFITSALTTVGSQCQYIADQTILYQTAAGTVQSGKAAAVNRFGLQIKAINGQTSNRFAIIQYIDPVTCRPYWGQILSSLLRARIFSENVDSAIRIKARLITADGVPATLSNTQPITSWAADADPIFAAQWTAIAPLNDPAYILPNAYDTDQGIEAFPGFSFDQFELPTCVADISTMGIVVYTMDDMDDTSGDEDYIVFDRISLVPNKFAVDAEPQTLDQVIQDCQYFYEKSYDQGVLPATITATGKRFEPAPLIVNGGDNSLSRKSFSLNYNTIKRSAPSVTFYSPTSATPSQIKFELLNAGTDVGGSPVDVAQSSFTGVNSTKCILMTPNTSGELVATTLGVSQEGRITYHFTADARLGLI